MLLPERLEGAVYGHLCGDALGVPYEFGSPDRIGPVEWQGGGPHAQPPGTWSDDGSLMLALLDSLLSAGFDPADQGRRALAWRDEGAYAPGGLVFDVGSSTTEALHALREGAPAQLAGGVEARGNGSLMRILPVPLVLRTVDDAELFTLACRASRVTHGSAEAQLACGLYALAVRRLLAGEDDRPAVLAQALRVARLELQAHGLPGSAVAAEPAAALAELDAFERWSGREGRGRVVDSFWSAWDAFAGAADYVSAVTAAVRYGHDTDTTAAIAGGLAGVCFGIEAVPSEWQRGLRDRHIAQALVDRLVETDRSEWDGTPWRTSHTKALRVDFMDLTGTDLVERGGRTGMTFLPGKRYMGYYSGPHWRDLDSDAASLREQGVDVMLLLVEDRELVRCRATRVSEVLPHHGIELIRHPIRDPETPGHDAAYRRTVSALVERVRGGATVAIACRGGLDRSGMTAACFLREAGLDADTAIDRVHAAREHTLT
ncbi:MAG: ADP-ribosylglycohydrolase family protein, partial [Candidatus Limnocylindrales bacterium]